MSYNARGGRAGGKGGPNPKVLVALTGLRPPKKEFLDKRHYPFYLSLKFSNITRKPEKQKAENTRIDPAQFGCYLTREDVASVQEILNLSATEAQKALESDEERLRLQKRLEAHVVECNAGFPDGHVWRMSHRFGNFHPFSTNPQLSAVEGAILVKRCVPGPVLKRSAAQEVIDSADWGNPHCMSVNPEGQANSYRVTGWVLARHEETGWQLQVAGHTYVEYAARVWRHAGGAGHCYISSFEGEDFESPQAGVFLFHKFEAVLKAAPELMDKVTRMEHGSSIFLLGDHPSVRVHKAPLRIDADIIPEFQGLSI